HRCRLPGARDDPHVDGTEAVSDDHAGQGGADPRQVHVHEHVPRVGHEPREGEGDEPEPDGDPQDHQTGDPVAASGRLTRHPYRYTLGTLTVILALMAAALYGSGVALQYREATKMPDSESVHLGLLVRLVKQPLWVLGVVFDFAGFALQA